VAVIGSKWQQITGESRLPNTMGYGQKVKTEIQHVYCRMNCEIFVGHPSHAKSIASRKSFQLRFGERLLEQISNIELAGPLSHVVEIKSGFLDSQHS
jgi:hypothetical protein